MPVFVISLVAHDVSAAAHAVSPAAHCGMPAANGIIQQRPGAIVTNCDEESTGFSASVTAMRMPPDDVFDKQSRILKAQNKLVETGKT